MRRNIGAFESKFLALLAIASLKAKRILVFCRKNLHLAGPTRLAPLISKLLRIRRPAVHDSVDFHPKLSDALGTLGAD